MRSVHYAALAGIVCLAVPAASIAQSDSPRRPIPYPVIPDSDYIDALRNGTRGETGEPGPNYWQQWTSYRIKARLLPADKRLEGTARIVYHNHAPRALPAVFLHLHQNLHAPGNIRNEVQEVTGGVHLERVAAAGVELEPEPRGNGPGYSVRGTIMALRLPARLASGDSVELGLDWSFAVPQSSSGRMGWSRDDLFHIAYWYPQMAVFDDVVGWQLDPYLGNAEFYAGFGDYDVTVEAPAGWVVRATGELQNPRDVLPPDVRERLERGARSDTVVHVLTGDQFGPGTATLGGPGATLRWRFRASRVRDFAFSAASRSMWDATRTPVGDRDGDGVTDYARIEILYREDAPLWKNTWRYAQHAIDFLSRWTGYPYPWPHMTAIEGGGIIGGGMEFPMMTLIGNYNQRSDSSLYYVTAHELAHMWVPMIVGTDEKRHAWMDEGTTSFNENQARKEFFPGIDHDEPDRNSYIQVARVGREGEMMRRSDYHYPGPAYGTASYSKPSTVLVALRGLLGEETFRRAYTQYIRDWAFKHPKPWDFFNTFSTVSGRDLDWFWRSWYYETWMLDQSVAAVTAGVAGETGAAETRITVEDLGFVPMPVRLTITLENGDTLRDEIPVDTWLAGNRSATVNLRTTSPVTRVEIDAEHAFPDVDRGNNVWERGRR